MKRTLVLAAHPNMRESKINKAWLERLAGEEQVTIRDLYDEYPDFRINVEKEQELAASHDRLVFQFPFYWYSSPAILKEWQDAVLTYGWAYGSAGKALHGKEFMLALSTGGPEEAYGEGGYNRYPIGELLRPFQAMANLTGMTFLPPFLLHGVRTLSDEQIRASAEALAARLSE
ncbi:NAD(P)H-dependent oxidoreductase [Paenibacillus sp. CC-CFT747]|nr:NAD(P)H-dependent oxidoreductase [Paenibacillus sp. CC-CFT747]